MNATGIYIKYAGRIYKALDFKESLGLTWYKIEDEPGHYDWVHGVVFVKEDEDETASIK